MAPRNPLYLCQDDKDPYYSPDPNAEKPSRYSLRFVKRLRDWEYIQFNPVDRLEYITSLGLDVLQAKLSALAGEKAARARAKEERRKSYYRDYAPAESARVHAANLARRQAATAAVTRAAEERVRLSQMRNSPERIAYREALRAQRIAEYAARVASGDVPPPKPRKRKAIDYVITIGATPREKRKRVTAARAAEAAVVAASDPLIIAAKASAPKTTIVPLTREAQQAALDAYLAKPVPAAPERTVAPPAAPPDDLYERIRAEAARLPSIPTTPLTPPLPSAPHALNPFVSPPTVAFASKADMDARMRQTLERAVYTPPAFSKKAETARRRLEAKRARELPIPPTPEPKQETSVYPFLACPGDTDPPYYLNQMVSADIANFTDALTEDERDAILENLKCR